MRRKALTKLFPLYPAKEILIQYIVFGLISRELSGQFLVGYQYIVSKSSNQITTQKALKEVD
jgi:hypothetical protein